MPYAVSLPDMTSDMQTLMKLRDLVSERFGDALAINGNGDEMALRLDCDDIRAEAIVTAIRLTLTRRQCRCYYLAPGRRSWKIV